MQNYAIMSQGNEDEAVGWALAPELTPGLTTSEESADDVSYGRCVCAMLGEEPGSCFACAVSSCTPSPNAMLDYSDDDTEFASDHPDERMRPAWQPFEGFWRCTPANTQSLRPVERVPDNATWEAWQRLRCTDERFADFADEMPEQQMAQ